MGAGANAQLEQYNNSGAADAGISMPQYGWFNRMFGDLNPVDKYAAASNNTAPITGQQSNTMMTDGQPNFLGANLTPQYYGNYMANLPSDMPGGGGGVINNYGAAPWIQRWNTGREGTGQFLNGAQPGGNAWQQGGQGYYQPYQMISGGGGYNIPGIGTGPFAYSNPYTQAAQGSNLNISDAFNNARYDQYQEYTAANPGSPGRGVMIGGKEYNFAPQRADTSPNSPFAGAVQQQGNSAGWQSGDTGPIGDQFNGSFQLNGGQSVTGNAPAQQQWNQQQQDWIRRYGRRLYNGEGWDSQHWSQVMANHPEYGNQRVQSYWNRLQQRNPEAYDFLKTNQEAIMQNPYTYYGGSLDGRPPSIWGAPRPDMYRRY